MVVAARTLALAAVELFESPVEVDAAKTAFEKLAGGAGMGLRILGRGNEAAAELFR